MERRFLFCVKVAAEVSAADISQPLQTGPIFMARYVVGGTHENLCCIAIWMTAPTPGSSPVHVASHFVCPFIVSAPH